MLDKLFLEHPRSVGETYFQHLCSAGSFALALFVAGAACLVHAILPFMFLKTGSRKVTELYRRMVTHRSRVPTDAGFPAALSFDI